MSDKTIYALCFRGTMDTVMVEQGLFYGQPTKSSVPTFMERDEVNRLLNNEAFLKNLLGDGLEIREVSVVFGSPITLRLLPPEQQSPRYQLPEPSSTTPTGKAHPMPDRKIPRDKGFNAVRHLISEVLLLVNENKSITKHKKHLLIRLAHQAAAAVSRSLKENPHA